ncbi:MAG: single-stranded-DNA-specific exonuclease RecJ [Deltaproteobacteria bacterium]|nr:single-stranded-DNA-specific exonuclease RecJ [Deltaproteobacteria bacterium]
MPLKSQWEIQTCKDIDAQENLTNILGVDPITACCLVNRGYSDETEARSFLNPQLKDLSKPFKMADLKKGVKRVADAIVSREKIAVFGDYDVDGLTSTSVMYLFLRASACTVYVNTADRFSGGYGLNIETVEGFKQSGCSTLIVLDCGTSDHEAILKANELGIDVVVIDHHRIDSDYPKAYAFINPQRPDCEFEDKTLAAVGLTFYFCASVRTELINVGYITQDEIDIKSLLDLVALGTIADVVPLGKNNRILASQGLKIMSKKRRPGIEALINSARIHSKNLNSYHVSFQIAPRINAAGRLANAMNAFELLVSTVNSDAEEYARILEQFTFKRREIESKVTAEAREQAKEQSEKGKRLIVVAGDCWHKGVLGIVAARLSEEFHRPVYVVGFDDNMGTGSARGPGQINLYDSLEHASSLLVRFGGHRDAAGFSVAREHLADFIKLLNEYAEQNWTEQKSGILMCDAKLNPSQLTSRLLNELLSLGPFGMQNPEPLFYIEGLDVLSARVVGMGHLKLLLKLPSGTVSAFGPGMGDAVGYISDRIDVVAAIYPDEWKGDGALELKLSMPPIVNEDYDNL